MYSPLSIKYPAKTSLELGVVGWYHLHIKPPFYSGCTSFTLPLYQTLCPIENAKYIPSLSCKYPAKTSLELGVVGWSHFHIKLPSTQYALQLFFSYC